MTAPSHRRWHHDTRWRLVVAVVCGVGVATAVGFLFDSAYSPLLGWTTTALLYCLITWASVGRMTASQTVTHATREAPGAWSIHILLVCAALASLAGIVILISSRPPGSRLTAAAIALVVIMASWVTVHTLHALRYAREYYGHGGGIDFHGSTQPTYLDFAYLAFTIGMSFAVSDPDLTTAAMRRIALGHSLLAYLFGTVFVAALVNILASLAA
ncbi:MAG: DUF1345 domain-containing protein [Propionibacteriaceae bacterium]|jgi:uncharacterized membrane protein|nr:DUF1345 domain-containing protein [Propionibacteriaceae bacterium]